MTSGNLNSNEGVVKSLTLPLQPHQPGHELTKEPFRWDQRLITISLRFPAYANAAVLNQYASSAAIGLQNPPILPCPENAEPTALMSKVTGGKCYQIHSMKELYQLIEQINNNFAKEPVVVVNFEKFDPKSMKSGIPSSPFLSSFPLLPFSLSLPFSLPLFPLSPPFIFVLSLLSSLPSCFCFYAPRNFLLLFLLYFYFPLAHLSLRPFPLISPPSENFVFYTSHLPSAVPFLRFPSYSSLSK